MSFPVDPWGSDPDRTTRHWRPEELPPYPCDICGMAIEAGEKFTHDPKGETTHSDRSMTLDDVTAASERLNAARAAERAAALELRDAIQSAREAGYSLAQIAQVLGISRQRVMQLSR